MIAVTLIALILGISQFAIHLLVFAGAFTVSLKLLEAASRSNSLFLGVIGSSLMYLFSVGPVLLSCRFLANGFSQPNVFESVARFFEVFYIPVYEMAEGFAETPILWYTDSWLLDHSWTANVADPAYLMFLVLIPWLLVFAVLGFVLSQQSSQRAVLACGASYLVFAILAVAASTTFW